MILDDLKIKDRIFLGGISGIIGNIPKNIFIFILYYFGIAKQPLWKVAASLYFPADKITILNILTLGLVTDYLIAGLFGILLVLILSYTGKDYYLFKGIGLGITFWVGLYGLLVGTSLTSIDPNTFGTNAAQLGAHIILGLVSSWFIVRTGRLE